MILLLKGALLPVVFIATVVRPSLLFGQNVRIDCVRFRYDLVYVHIAMLDKKVLNIAEATVLNNYHYFTWKIGNKKKIYLRPE